MNLKKLALEIYSIIRIPKFRRSDQSILLVVGMVESSHFQSWLRATIREQIFDQIWIIPSDYPRKKLTQKTLGLVEDFDCKLKIFHFPVNKKTNRLLFKGLDLVFGKEWRAIVIFKYMKVAKPQFLHFHELQHGAYLFNPIYKYFKDRTKVKIISSTWGSDLLFYGKLQSHKSQISKVLLWSDVVTAERTDDMLICDEFNFKNQFLAPVYITVGLKSPLRIPTSRPSNRKMIMIKGYQDNHGRALNALSALELVQSDLKDYEIWVFSASEAVALQVEFLKSSKGWNIGVISRTTNQEIKKYFSQSRLYIGLAISDGLSTSMVEAMAEGTFPIQSMNSAAGVFIEDGVTGFIVNPWETKLIAQRIDQALNDDSLVDNAVELNIRTLENKYSYESGIAKIKKLYEES